MLILSLNLVVVCYSIIGLVSCRFISLFDLHLFLKSTQFVFNLFLLEATVFYFELHKLTVSSILV